MQCKMRFKYCSKCDLQHSPSKISIVRQSAGEQQGPLCSATMSQTEAGIAALCDASFQTEQPADLDDAAKQDILDSFAMELFLTSVLPRHETFLATHKEGAKEDVSHHQYVLLLTVMNRL